jgi:hypothetical protein
MEMPDPVMDMDNETMEGYSNYSLDPALCGNVTPEYERVSLATLSQSSFIIKLKRQYIYSAQWLP